ncbi:hypothetical protein N780_13470 [Pontibacillus chungwhensis BH030062]|uniref:DUF559 domain-containing protein n=1 Tax=Pontibacillus chungwhensis BH030062 TaxID=1385513 RepID=A0A0A2VGH4_9BACI|nr:hypothetical protein [Pontibacillus chungwhensis]KGP92730.1 hypothetical protein N780_13470 [Pontibacillus chungwhensis BH030062]
MVKNKKKLNGEMVKYYRECSSDAYWIYVAHFDTHCKDPDIPMLEKKHQQLKRKHCSEFNMTKEDYVKMMLCTRELVKVLGLKEFLSSWDKFKSPTEVVVYYAATFIWNPLLISVNLKEVNGFYEVDLTLKDFEGNIVLLIDVQGKVHNEPSNQINDRQKKQHYYDLGICFLQVRGVDVKNYFTEHIELFSKKIEEVYSVGNVKYLKSYMNTSFHQNNDTPEEKSQ